MNLRNFINIKLMLMMGMVVISFPSCTGVLGGLYDEVSTEMQPGFNNVRPDNTGTIYIDATSYTQWHYIDIESQTISIEELPVPEYLPDNKEQDSQNSVQNLNSDKPSGVPENWQFAIHRYDCKTNGGAACETEFTDIRTFIQSINKEGIQKYDFVEDVKASDPQKLQDENELGKIVVDMSHMMDGWLGYASSDINLVVGRWLDVNKSQMPPIYTPSGKVYVIKMSDGTYGAIQLRDFKSKKNIKGVMTIDYAWPLDLD